MIIMRAILLRIRVPILLVSLPVYQYYLSACLLSSRGCVCQIAFLPYIVDHGIVCGGWNGGHP